MAGNFLAPPGLKDGALGEGSPDLHDVRAPLVQPLKLRVSLLDLVLDHIALHLHHVHLNNPTLTA